MKVSHKNFKDWKKSTGLHELGFSYLSICVFNFKLTELIFQACLVFLCDVWPITYIKLPPKCIACQYNWKVQGVLQQTALFLWAGTQRVCMSHKNFLHIYEAKTWDNLLECINPIWSHKKCSKKPSFKNFEISLSFLIHS